MISGWTNRKATTAALAAMILGAGMMAGPSNAEAYWRPRGGAVAAGVIGGLAAGALIASAARPAYAYPYGGYYGAPVGYRYDGGYAPVAHGGYYAPAATYYAAPTCWTETRRTHVDPWTVVVKRVRVCQ